MTLLPIRRKHRGRVAIALFALGAVSLLPRAASAHSLLLSSAPAPNQRLGTTPGLVHLFFSEPLDPKLSRVTVTDPTGRGTNGKITATQMVVLLSTNAPGPYEVSWTSVSAVD